MKRRWYTVGRDTVQASSMAEAQRIVKTMKAFEKQKGKKNGKDHS